MKLHKRRKKSRFRGSVTHGRGFKKKARGSGHRGGFGMAGTGKRGDQKKTLITMMYGNDYFGKDKTLRKPVVVKTSVLNLDDIESNLSSFVKQGIAKEKSGTYDINLSDTRILGDGSVKTKLIITANSASKSAIDKIKKAGGDIKVKEVKVNVVKPKKVEEVEVKAKAK